MFHARLFMGPLETPAAQCGHTQPLGVAGFCGFEKP